MCGIFGIIAPGGLAPEDAGLSRRLVETLVHRGLDGEGFHIEASVAIGMRRLAIIDPECGWQPLYNETRDIALVCNGEIYNFLELRAELEKQRGIASDLAATAR